MAKVKKLQWIDLETEVCSIGHLLWAIWCYIRLLLRFPYRFAADVVMASPCEKHKACAVAKVCFWFMPRLKIKWKRE